MGSSVEYKTIHHDKGEEFSCLANAATNLLVLSIVIKHATKPTSPVLTVFLKKSAIH